MDYYYIFWRKFGVFYRQNIFYGLGFADDRFKRGDGGYRLGGSLFTTQFLSLGLYYVLATKLSRFYRFFGLLEVIPFFYSFMILSLINFFTSSISSSSTNPLILTSFFSIFSINRATNLCCTALTFKINSPKLTPSDAFSSAFLTISSNSRWKRSTSTLKPDQSIVATVANLESKYQQICMNSQVSKGNYKVVMVRVPGSNANSARNVFVEYLLKRNEGLF